MNIFGGEGHVTRLRVLKKDYELPRAKKQFKASTNSSLFREEGQHEFVDMKKMKL